MTAAQQERALGLVRVSKEREGMVAPEMQRAAIKGYAETRGYEVADWLEGLDESGSRARSAWWPRLDQAVEMVEAGRVDVVLVWKFSRTARNRLRWAVALDRVETAGGRLESATEQVDATTSTGRFTRGMLAELNAFEAERIGEVWREVHARRVRSGRPASGKLKFGYAYDKAGQVHVPDPVTGPLLASVYTRYVAGESVHQLVRWLNLRGHRTLDGGVWSDRSLRRVLDSGFASGRFLVAGQFHDGIHEPVIGQQLWEAYLAARGARRALPARTERSQYLLSGLVRCGRCGGSMVAGQFGDSRTPKYRCARGKEQGPTACTGGYVMASLVEGHVVEWLHSHLEALEAAVAAFVLHAPRPAPDDHGRLEHRVEQVEQAMTRLVVQQAQAPAPAVIYVRAMQELTDQLDAIRQAQAAAVLATGAAPDGFFANASELLDRWKHVPVEHRRTILRTLIARIVVTTGRPRGHVVIEEGARTP